MLQSFVRGAEKTEVMLGKYSREVGRVGKETAKSLMESVEQKKTSLCLMYELSELVLDLVAVKQERYKHGSSFFLLM